MSFEDRDLLINNLSKSAQHLFKVIQSLEPQWTEKDNSSRKRDSTTMSLPNYEEEEEEEEEDEEEDEEEERFNNDTPIKVCIYYGDS